ncbi:hypothetical protein [Chondrinema litorale]|uniref:hypothetical protein n=1 Tax=Chondrinema litorale TaxID=2994555 RepID=UPI002542E11B|nr:hypothetical protein [Chondrinema litorale]UZR99103.1 hypothetical protein OQ292_35120 [Chondrinema litorale]
MSKKNIIRYKWILILGTLFLHYSYVKAQDFIRVDFQDYFEGERVSLFVNGAQIFEGQKLETASTGETGFSLLFTKRDSNYYFITQFYPFKSKIPYRKKKIYKQVNTIDAPYQLSLKKLENKVVWTFSIAIKNGEKLEREIDIRKGNYIGVTYNDFDSKGLSIVQSDIPFAYD